MKITLLGIDGSGKSTLSLSLKKHYEARGFRVSIVPFHQWVFAAFFRDRLGFGKLIDRGRKQGRKSYHKPSKRSLSSIIKPPIALLDNIIFYHVNKPRSKRDIYIYDRFICATQIKMNALNYRTNWMKFIWANIKTDYTFYLDVDPYTSLERQRLRNDPYTYPTDILQKERELYLQISKKNKYSVIPNSSSLKDAFDLVVSAITL